MEQQQFPTEMVTLPSKGLLYSEESGLKSGKVEMKYMTAKEEDILTNQSYISKGIVLDKLMQSLIVSEIKYNELLIGDKNAIMVAARILGYGSEYKFSYLSEDHTINLSLLENKEIDESLFKKGINAFDFTLPFSKNKITFKLLNGKDEKNIQRELDGLKKINKDNSPEISTRLKYMITSVEGKTETKDIREFVDDYFLAKDSRKLREYVKEIQPDVDLTFFPNGEISRVTLPIGINFFWPDI